MTKRWIGRSLAAAGILGLAIVGIVLGGLVGTIGSARAGEDFEHLCERDRCSESTGGCRDAGQQETLCNLHDFGCGTIPCDLSWKELATFDRDDAPEIWMAWGPQAIPRLAKLAFAANGSSPPTVQLQALTTLAKIAREWDVRELRPEFRGDLSRVAVAYTRRPLDQVSPNERAESLKRGIDIAMILATELDHPYYRESVRMLEEAATVRARLAADATSVSDSIVVEITRYAKRAR